MGGIKGGKSVVIYEDGVTAEIVVKRVEGYCVRLVVGDFKSA